MQHTLVLSIQLPYDGPNPDMNVDAQTREQNAHQTQSVQGIKDAVAAFATALKAAGYSITEAQLDSQPLGGTN